MVAMSNAKKKLSRLILSIGALGGLMFFVWPQPARAALVDDLAGRILLEVEAHGEAWYVNPVELKRYYLGRPDDAWELMRSFGLGITNADLAQIPVSSDSGAGDYALRARVSGRILLQVEAHGEAWYVNPVDLKRYYLGRPADAFALMSSLGLGITSANLATISSATVSSTSTNQTVPFTTQAPYADWGDARQQEGCEEASTLMAIKWVRGESLSADEALTAILAMSDWELAEYGYFQDTGAQDTADRLLRTYYGYQNVEVRFDINAADVADEITKGNIVMVPINGQAMAHDYYTGAGPARHMILVHGYDTLSGEVILHDPGTRYGENLRVSLTALDQMMRDYTSGVYAPIGEGRTAMVVIWK